MNFDSIRTFLTVVETGNISSAAQELFTSQSNISRRISSLEEEVGAPLLVRSKGQQSIELTPAGEEFLIYARQMDLLTRDIESIKEMKERKYLSIGCIDTFNTINFVAFYKEFIRRHPDICLSIHTYHSTEIYSRLDNHLLDLGYVITSKPRPDINISLLYQEPMAIAAVGPNEYYDGIPLRELPVEKEIYLNWNRDYEITHSNIFSGKKYRVRVSTESMLFSFLENPGEWALVPESTAKSMAEKIGTEIYSSCDYISNRRCYELEHKYTRPSRKEAVEVFKKEFHEYIHRNIASVLHITEEEKDI